MREKSLRWFVGSLSLCLLAWSASADSPSAGAVSATLVLHRVLPGERLSEIAARYAADEAVIASDNRLSDVPLRAGATLRVLATRIPPARQRVRYRARRGERFADIAQRHGVGEAELRRWNRARAGVEPSPGTRLTLWVEPGKQLRSPFAHDADAAGLPLVPLSGSGESRGRPDRGRLRGGVRMPHNPALYTIRRPDFAWGSSHTVHHLQLAVAKFRAHGGYRGALVVSDMSRAGGGRYGPHRSHQSGRDVDLWLPLRAEAAGAARGLTRDARFSLDFAALAPQRARDIDWRAAWELVKALLRTGEVQDIFLSRSRQRPLLRAALDDGFTRGELGAIIQFPARRRGAVVSHVRGHDRHMHVRFRCAPHERHCR